MNLTDMNLDQAAVAISATMRRHPRSEVRTTQQADGGWCSVFSVPGRIAVPAWGDSYEQVMANLAQVLLDSPYL